MLTLTLPYPISANRYWQPVKIGAHITIVPTKDAKAYRKEVACLAFTQGVRRPIAGRIKVTLQLYPHRPLDWQKRQRLHGAAWDDTVQCMDLTNAEKVLLDALNGVAFEDDNRIFDYHAQRMEPDQHGARVVIVIESLATQPAQQEIAA